MGNVKNSKAYKSLRDYVKNTLELSATELEQDLAHEIGVSVKSIQNICCDKRDFKWSEAKSSAEFFIKKCEGHEIDKTILRRLVYIFLLTYGSASDDAEVNESVVNNILKPHFSIDVSSETMPCIYSFSNLPELRYEECIVRRKLYEQAKKSIANHRIVFLSGFPGTGKSFIANVLAREYLNDEKEKYNIAIWNDCRLGNISFNDFIVTILSAFNYENVGNLSMEEKVSMAKKLLAGTKTIIVIDGFESICNNYEKKQMISFLSEQISQETRVIITCSERLSVFRKDIKSMTKFKEIQVNVLSPREWEYVSENLSESRSDIEEARTLIPELDDYVYELCKGNLYLMIHMLSAVSEKILNGFDFQIIRKEYQLPDIDGQSYNTILIKSISDLSDNNMRMLLALSLFIVPVTIQELSRVSGLDGVDEKGNLVEGSSLAKSLLQCHNLYLVDRCISNGVMKFSLPFMVRAILGVDLEKYNSLRRLIVKQWIDYYLSFSEKIGFCFDDFKRLEILDADSKAREIENVKAILSYCEKNCLWDYFYSISENTKYFFYTRGISGEGRNSIHYRRALAAKNLHNYQNEYDSLVYHCNVSCKVQSWSNIEECFFRIETLEKEHADISITSKMKYQYIKALYLFSKGDYEASSTAFTNYESKLSTMIDIDHIESDNKILVHDYIASLRWHSECLLRLAQNDSSQGNSNVDEEIQALLTTAIKFANKINFERAIVHSYIIRIKACLVIKNDYVTARKMLGDLKSYSSIIENDAHYNKEYKILSEELKRG